MTSRPLGLVVAFFGSVAPALAQGVIGGAALDAETGVPLACLEVALTDSAGRALAVTGTDARGLFQLAPTPTPASFLRFRMPGALPVMAAAPAADSTGEALRAYRLAFDTALTRDVVRPRPRGAPENAAADSDPGILPVPTPRYPAAAQRDRVAGTVAMQFTVDAGGRVPREGRRVLAAPAQVLTDAVVEFLDVARFAPARHRGATTCRVVRAPFTFVLPH